MTAADKSGDYISITAPTKKYYFSGFIIFMQHLFCLIGMLSFYALIWKYVHYEYAYTLSQCFFWIGILYVLYSRIILQANKKILLEKLKQDYINNFIWGSNSL